MRYKKFGFIMIATFLSFNVIACNSEKETSANVEMVSVEKEIKYNIGNDLGNIAKGGNLAYNGDDIYYSFLGKLYRKNMKTNDIVSLSKGGYAISYMNIINDAIYSIDLNEDNDTQIVYRDLEGKNAKVLSKEPCRELMVDKNYIYYVGIKDETNNAVIKRMNLDGSNKCVLYEPGKPVSFNNFKDSISMVGKYIILQYSDGYKILDRESNKFKEYPMKDSYMVLDYALKDEDLYINIVPIYDYFPNFPFKPTLRRINLKENKDEVINTEAIYFQLLDDGIYYFTVAPIGESDGLYKVDLDGKNKTLISNTDNRLAYKANNRLYYIVNGNNADIISAINK